MVREKMFKIQLRISGGMYASKRRPAGGMYASKRRPPLAGVEDPLWQTKPRQMDSQMIIMITIMMARTMSFTFMFWNHILRRSFPPVRWKLSACADKTQLAFIEVIPMT